MEVRELWLVDSVVFGAPLTWFHFHHCTNEEAKVNVLLEFHFHFSTLAELQNWNNFEKLKACTYFSHLQLPKYVCANLKVF